MTLVTLPDGKTLSESMIKVMGLTCTAMLDSMEGTLALYELVELANNPNHQIFSPVQFEYLRRRNILTGTRERPLMHDDIRTFVKNCVKFDGMNVTIGLPAEATASPR